VIKPVPDELVLCLAFAPDGRTFAAGQFAPDGPTPAASQLARVSLYDTASGKLLRTIVSESRKRSAASFKPRPSGVFPAWVVSLDFSPDGKLLAGCRSDGSICLWKTVGDEKPALLEGHQAWVASGRFSPDGALLASEGLDHNVLVWDVKQRKVKARLIGRETRGLAFSPGGKLLAWADGGQINLWDVAAGRQRQTLDGSGDLPTCLAFSPDGETIVCSNLADEIRIWDVRTGAEKGSLRARADTWCGVYILGDNRTAISASSDGAIRAWDLARQKQIGSVSVRSRQSVDSMAISPDGKSIACGDPHGAIELIKVARLLHGASRVSPPVTPEDAERVRQQSWKKPSIPELEEIKSITAEAYSHLPPLDAGPPQ
jgi:WD40 repeat protein